MHPHFADWYRPCTTGTETNLTSELLEQRWAAVMKASEAPKPLELVRTILQRPARDANYISTLRLAFKDADTTFAMSGNDLEVSILAGSVLGNVIASEAPGADEASLGLLCATGARSARPVWATPFITMADQHLDRRLRSLRAQDQQNRLEFDVSALEPHTKTLIAKLTENPPAQAGEAAKHWTVELVRSIEAFAGSTRGAIAELWYQSQLRKEETDVLSWLTAKVSRDLDAGFDRMKRPEASLVAGKELADLVRPPGVLAARSILAAVIPPAKGKAKETVSTIVAVNALPLEWRQLIAKRRGVESTVDLCPVIGAITASLTTDNEGDWPSVYSKSHHLDPTVAFPATDLAFQMHRECLLQKTV